jgi:hypothetical protein
MTLPCSAVPKEGFLPDYLAYVKDFTASPKIYHYFTALAILGTVMGRKVYLKVGSRWLFPNMYIILLGRSGIMKSSAMNEGVSLLRKHNIELTYPNEVSPQMLKFIMTQRPRGLFPLDEMDNFLAEADKTFDGIKQFITTIYDCPPRYEKGLKGEGIAVIDHPFLSIIGTTTPESLVERLTVTDMKSGYWGRHLIVPAWEPEEWIVWPPPCDEDKRNELVNFLGALSTNPPSCMEPMANAFDLYKTWDESWRNLKSTVDPRLEPMYARLPETVRKISMILQWSYEPADYVSEEAMTMAIEAVNYIMSQYPRLSEDFGFSKPEKDRNNVIRIIRDKGKEGVCKHSVALKYSHMMGFEFQRVIDTLKASGIIQEKAYHTYNLI